MEYKNFERFFGDYKYQEKYRFVRNHPSGTMEFRFLSPCEHKEANMEKFLNYMIKTLNTQEHKKSSTITIGDNMSESDYNFTLALGKVEDKDFNYTIEATPGLIIDDYEVSPF